MPVVIGAISIGIGAMSVGTGAMSIDTGAMSIDTGAMSIDTGAMSIDTGAMSIDTGAMSIDTGDMSVMIGAISVVIGAISSVIEVISIVIGAISVRMEGYTGNTLANLLRSRSIFAIALLASLMRARFCPKSKNPNHGRSCERHEINQDPDQDTEIRRLGREQAFGNRRIEFNI